GREVAGLDPGRARSGVAPRRQGALLPGPVRLDDGRGRGRRRDPRARCSEGTLLRIHQRPQSDRPQLLGLLGRTEIPGAEAGPRGRSAVDDRVLELAVRLRVAMTMASAGTQPRLSAEDLAKSPNPIARHYSRFRVAERMLLTGHSHQAWPDVGFEGQ